MTPDDVRGMSREKLSAAINTGETAVMMGRALQTLWVIGAPLPGVFECHALYVEGVSWIGYRDGWTPAPTARDLCTVQHGDWTGPHERERKCPPCVS